jgi:hypothetical protein
MAHDDTAGTHCDTLMQFSGEDLNPESISSLIDLKPSSSGKKGEPMARPRPGPPTPLARRGGISYSTYRSVVSDDINDSLGIEVILDDPDTITVVEET